MTSHDDLGLLPRPCQCEALGGWLDLSARLTVHVAERLHPARTLLLEVLSQRLGIDIAFTDERPAGLSCEFDPSLGPEAYRLSVDEDIRIEAGGAPGAIWALRTLQQLIGPPAYRAANPPRAAGEGLAAGRAMVARARVVDAPRFAHRGVLLDVARHFLPKDSVMRFIELASAHKLNVLHLHLTDDQGWRPQIAAHPRLTEIGSWRERSQVGSSRSELFDDRPHGGFYTQADLAEIVAFAHTRAVTVVPEIDVPGHSQAAMAAYPHLSTGGKRLAVWTRWGLNPHTLAVGDDVLDFYRTVLSEICEVFDSPLICLGGDEVPTEPWAADPASRARAAELELASVSELLPWFVGQLADHLRALGRRASVWDEVCGARVPRDVVVNSWRGYRGAIDALRDGHDTVICPEHRVFLDHRAAPGLDEPAPVGTVHTIEDVYGFEPISAALAEAAREPGAGRVLGAQAQVWTEQLDSPRRIDYAAYPRLTAFAEVVWTDADLRSWPSFEGRLRSHHLARLDAAGVEYRPLAGPLPWQRLPAVPGWPLRFDELGNLVHAPDGAR